MIRYALKCGQSHSFESWFQSASAFDTLKAAGHVACPTCGAKDVVKAIMAPQISKSTAAGEAERASGGAEVPMASEPTVDRGAAEGLAKMREHVEKNSDYVGANFAREARAIHDGASPERSIYGQAKPEEAKALIEDGIPVVPLPFVPSGKLN